MTPLDEVKAQIKDQLLREKRQAELDKWLKDVEKKYENATVYGPGFEPPKTETGTTAATTTQE